MADQKKAAAYESQPTAEKQDASVSKGMDEAAGFLAHSAGYEPLSPEEEQRMIRKTDWILLPMLFLTASLGAVDKVAISTAAIYGLKRDLHLAGQEFSWAGSILFLGEIAGMWPSSYLVNRLPSAKYLSACSIGWSVLALLMPVSHNWSGFDGPEVLHGLPRSHNRALDLAHCGRFLQKIGAAASERDCICRCQLYYQRLPLVGCWPYPIHRALGGLAVPFYYHR